MRFDLAALTRRQRNPRRTLIPLRAISAQATRATDLYRAAYLPVIQAWTEALPAIEADYARSLSNVTQDSAATLETEIQRAENTVGAFLLSVRPRVERWARQAEAWHRMRWRRAVLDATSVDLATLIGPEDARETLETIIARNVGLVRSVSDETRRRIGDAVFRGLTERRPSREVAKEIREAVAITRRRALRIAADQNVKLSSALNDERRRQAGIDSWQWVHSDKPNFRPEHDARDGKLYSENSERVGSEYQGKLVRKPPEDKPGQLPFCGCTSKAVLILE
ncbi:hypothetical protein INR77_08930 [Erythrobacter sp. SCSIO 43205]|uniref:phage minor head protein n=1 Tax=Erythrobacter sp. SCSIO 43205 TaxID=2779361 RepID=UPI001CA9D4CF|nr:phage minor head protein [Erythrobacter sp. SCSIO 43205]UAB76971.1 hypothetical protein INR77_08930 [Erythrobacter sp. SCSIO 43205]